MLRPQQQQQQQQLVSSQSLTGPPMKKSRTLSSTEDLKTTTTPLPTVNYPMPYHPGSFTQQLPMIPSYSSYSSPIPPTLNSVSNSVTNSVCNSASDSPSLAMCNNNVILQKKNDISERQSLDNHIQTLKNSLSTITDLVKRHTSDLPPDENTIQTNDALNKDLRTSLSLLQNSKEEILQLENKWTSMQSFRTIPLPLQETTNTSSSLTPLTSTITPKSMPIMTKTEVANNSASY